MKDLQPYHGVIEHKSKKFYFDYYFLVKNNNAYTVSFDTKTKEWSFDVFPLNIFNGDFAFLEEISYDRLQIAIMNYVKTLSNEYQKNELIKLQQIFLNDEKKLKDYCMICLEF